MPTALLAIMMMFSSAPQRPTDDPFVAIGVWYAGPGVLPPMTGSTDIAALRGDLALIRRRGFNAVTTWIHWRTAEPREGSYAVAGTERLIAAAVEAELKVSVVVFTDPAPTWGARPSDAADRFVAYLGRRLLLQPGVLGIVRHTPAGDRSAGRIGVGAAGGPAARLAMWSAIARGERTVAFQGTQDSLAPAVLSLGETAGVVTRNQALFAPLRPRTGGVISVTAEGGAPLKTPIHLLESEDALMIIGLNNSPSPLKVTITFSPDIPEAIWQNLETGAAVNFVMGKNGPFLDHTFAPRDAVVLMIRKQPR